MAVTGVTAVVHAQKTPLQYASCQFLYETAVLGNTASAFRLYSLLRFCFSMLAGNLPIWKVKQINKGHVQ